MVSLQDPQASFRIKSSKKTCLAATIAGRTVVTVLRGPGEDTLHVFKGDVTVLDAQGVVVMQESHVVPLTDVSADIHVSFIYIGD